MLLGGSLVGAAIVSTAGAARADEPDNTVTLVIPGYLFGAIAGAAPARAHGAELTLLHVTNVDKYTGIGLVGQAQSYDGSHLRVAVAAEATWACFGLELGWAMRRSDGAYATQHGIHVAPYLSLGLVSLAVRTTVPVFGDTNAYGWELGFVLGLKLPIPVRNWRALGGLYPAAPGVGGRPLRDEDGAPLLPDVVEARTQGVLPKDRARWIRDGRLEHASIESFQWLADDLDAHGAPSELVERAAAAAIEEARHAAICLQNAGVGVRLRGRLHPRRRRARPSIERLAHEAWNDGVLGEGRAALDLLNESLCTLDPLRAAQLRRIAVEEASHARLSADILAWTGTR